GSPWYRPTRVVHATDGSEFGWRSGTGCWPSYFLDSLPPAVDIGPGSPVGVEFGYGAKFPADYQKALFILDWTFGTIYAIHLEPTGATYTGRKEEFLSRSPLPLTDVVVGKDGALYFTVGGRGTQSELYRVTYVGKESTAPVDPRNPAGAEQRELRRKLESLHQPVPNAESVVGSVVEQLKNPDRFVRYAARVALEFQPLEVWRDAALKETDPTAVATAVVAVAHQGKPVDRAPALAALEKIDFKELKPEQRLQVLRAYGLAFIRLGEPGDALSKKLAKKFSYFFPSGHDLVDRELASLLVYLRSDDVVSKTIPLLAKKRDESKAEVDALIARNSGYGGVLASMARNQPDGQQIHYALVLRNVKTAWTLDQRRAYFKWFEQARKWSGGVSFQGFLRNIDREAFENATDAERLAIEASGARTPYRAPELPKAAGPGRDWKLDDVMKAAEGGLKQRDFKNGERSYAAARCVVCHRFGGDGGATGPDLTQAAGRFSLKDLAEAVVDPNKVISDQYKATVVLTDEGQQFSGRIVSDTPDAIVLVADPSDATKIVTIPKDTIEEKTMSKVSLMPADLFKPLNQDELLDLLAYILSRGNPNDAMFKK
ncbi:MAG: c-type cytochrome, partial [Planctomycetia bacterium]